MCVRGISLVCLGILFTLAGLAMFVLAWVFCLFLYNRDSLPPLPNRDLNRHSAPTTWRLKLDFCFQPLFLCFRLKVF